jgi:hypothetical protein
MRFKRILRRLFCYFRYYLWAPFLRWVAYPSYMFFRRTSRRWRRFRRKLRRSSSAMFWLTVSYIEHSPARFRGFVRGIYWRTRRFVLSFRVTHVFLDWARRFFRVYFKIVSFRRLLCVYIALDYFVYRWSDQGIDKDLRMWNLCMLCAFFNVLYMLMDASDKRLTHNSHDFLTRLYFRNYLRIEPGKVLSKEQMAEPMMARYINLRYRRNAVLAIFGFFYTGQPLFRSYK